MKCPACDDGDTKVIDSRAPATSSNSDDADAMARLLGTTTLRWRRRECLDCNYRYSTVEVGASLLRQLVETVEGAS